VNEAEVESLRAFVLGMLHIVDLLLARQFGPRCLSPLVPDDIIELDKDKQANVIAADP
jgi:hypothetical protein